MLDQKTAQRELRHRRIRSRIKGTAARPRLSVYRSNTRLVAQLVDDEKGETIAAVSSSHVKGKTHAERIKESAAGLARQAKAKGVSKVVFDRGGFKYAGIIKAFADAAREEGLAF